MQIQHALSTFSSRPEHLSAFSHLFLTRFSIPTPTFASYLCALSIQLCRGAQARCRRLWPDPWHSELNRHPSWNVHPHSHWFLQNSSCPLGRVTGIDMWGKMLGFRLRQDESLERTARSAFCEDSLFRLVSQARSRPGPIASRSVCLVFFCPSGPRRHLNLFEGVLLSLVVFWLIKSSSRKPYRTLPCLAQSRNSPLSGPLLRGLPLSLIVFSLSFFTYLPSQYGRSACCYFEPSKGPLWSSR